MGVKDMVMSNLITLFLLILVNTMCMSFGSTAWIVFGLLMLAVALFSCFRQGMNIGHEGCGVLQNIEAAAKEGKDPYALLGKKYCSGAWSVSRGIKGVFASALIPYAVNCVYIVLMLMDVLPAAIIARVAAWLISLPYWPILLHWYETFTTLEAPIVIMLMVSPFIMPAATFIGYLQGPKLWKKTEEAMAQGKRRAKAKSRVGKKMAPKVQKPEI